MLNNLLPWGKKQERSASDTDTLVAEPSQLARLRDEFDAMLEHFRHAPSLRGEPSEGLESTDPWNVGWGCDLQDKDNEVVVRAEAPGFDPEEIDVRVSGNRLVMEAEHKTESEKNGGSYQYQRFFRTMTIPRGIQADQIEAQYKNGVLEVHLPKGPDAQAKRIAVKAV